MILDEIKNCMRVEPEKAKQLSDAYRTLCAAYELRVRAENVENRGSDAAR